MKTIIDQDDWVLQIKCPRCSSIFKIGNTKWSTLTCYKCNKASSQQDWITIVSYQI